MDLNLEQRLRMMVGELVIQNMALQMENEKLKVQAAAASKPEPEPEIKYDEHHGVTADLHDGREFGVPVNNGSAKPV